MGSEGAGLTDREEMERREKARCVCGVTRLAHAYVEGLTPVQGESGQCYHFVPQALPIPTIGQDHPLRQRRASW